MKIFKSYYQISISGIIIFASVMGLILSLLFYFGYSPAINSIFISTAVIGLVFSLLLVWLAMVGKHGGKVCYCKYIPLTLFSSLALLVLSVLTMATTVTPEFISFAVLVYLGATMLFISVTGLFAIVNCIVAHNCLDCEKPIC